MAQENSKTLISATEIGVIKEHIPEEPHRVFITIPEIAIKEEIFDEELPDIQDQAFSDEYASSGISTVIKEDVDIVTESSCRSLNTSSVVKEEFISEDVSNGNKTNMCFTSGTSTDVNEEITVGCENEVDWSKYSQSDVPQVFRLPQVLAQRNTTQKNNGRNFECDVCNKTFISASILSKHKLFHSGIKNYKCDVCTKAFTTLSNLSNHKLIHSGIKRFQCDICKKAFTQSGDLSKHKLIHSGVRKYQCDVCHKTFTQKGNLTTHKLLHIGLKEYQCDECNKTFTQASNLSTHKLHHSGIRKYQCDICNKAFTTSGNLSKHKLIHSGIRKYHCDICNKAFTQAIHLSRHTSLHSGIRK